MFNIPGLRSNSSNGDRMCLAREGRHHLCRLARHQIFCSIPLQSLDRLAILAMALRWPFKADHRNVDTSRVLYTQGHVILTSSAKQILGFWTSNSTSGNLSEETQNTNLKEYMHPYVYCSIIYNSHDLETPKCPSVVEGMKKWGYIYAMEYYLAIKKKTILPFEITWMNLESIILSEISQS